MLDLDIKSMVFGGVLSLAVGGGLYGLYLKTLGPSAITQGQTYGLIQECASLLGSSNSVEIKQFLQKIDQRKKEINKSDATVTAIGLAAGQSYDDAPGMGKPLAMCAKELASKVESLRN
ncbi:hypothetical protein HC725_15360 [Vibrio sp. S17_S38]|uniref:hypothetical protein n=1 Tax=Vibrio sp. S17_S38 TaxID=2720229 RepID=UPI001681A925|nr:hypothetical protein [Vibrio sp. S17_S38]MBD1574641.1 hypothetical protein [Vibrio sp. S17_S38]